MQRKYIYRYLHNSTVYVRYPPLLPSVSLPSPLPYPALPGKNTFPAAENGLGSVQPFPALSSPALPCTVAIAIR